MIDFQGKFSALGVVSWGLSVQRHEVGDIAIYDTFRRGWREKYLSEKLYLLDPVFDFFRQRQKKTSRRILQEKEMQTELFEMASGYNAASSIAITSFVGGTFFTFGGATAAALSPDELQRIEYTCEHTHRSILAGNIIKLSEMQCEILEMIEMGYTVKEISYDLNISTRQVENHKKTICETLGVNRLQVAASIYSFDKWGAISGWKGCI